MALIRKTSPASPRRGHRRARAGFTFAELTMGLCLMALIAGAVAAMSRAVTDGWEQTEATQTVQMTTRQVTAQLERYIRDAKYIGLATADGAIVQAPGGTGYGPLSSYGAALMFWRDNTNTTGMQLQEINLIERDVTTNTLKLYSVPSTAANANVTCTFNDIKTTDAAKAFKALQTCTSQTIATNITSASFSATVPTSYSTGQRPSVQFTLKIVTAGPRSYGHGITRVQYGTATVRAPTTQP